MKKTPLKDTAVFVVKVTAGAVRAVLAVGAKRVVKIPEVDELPEGRMVDLPGRGSTYVVDVPGPTPERRPSYSCMRWPARPT